MANDKKQLHHFILQSEPTPVQTSKKWWNNLVLWRRPMYTTVQEMEGTAPLSVLFLSVGNMRWYSHFFETANICGSISKKCIAFIPTAVSQGSEQWSQIACSHDISLYSCRSSSKSNLIESGNTCQRLPWQHLSTKLICYCIFHCGCSQYTQWVQLVLCSSDHFDYCGVCMGEAISTTPCVDNWHWLLFQQATYCRPTQVDTLLH